MSHHGDHLERAVNDAHKQYWVANTFNGYDEFICTEELSFDDFRKTCIEKYIGKSFAPGHIIKAPVKCCDHCIGMVRQWSDDTKKVNRDWLVQFMQDRIDGINKHRRVLGRSIDAHMQRIITREADATKDSRNPRTYLDFVTTRVPSIRFVIRRYGGTADQAAHRIEDMKLGSKHTTKEWYNQYKALHRQAYLSEETAKVLTLPEHANRKGYEQPEKHPIKQSKKSTKKPKPPLPSPPSNKRVYDKDIAYPFKSKIKRYRKDHPNEPVQFIETPKQTRIDYKHIQRPYFSNTRDAWEIDHCFNMAQPGDKWMFCININTRYLVVYEIPERADHVLNALEDLHRRYHVKSIRGDGSTAYCPHRAQDQVLSPEKLRELLSGSRHTDFGHLGISYDILDWAMHNGITLYFNSGKFTLHNKIIDVAIKTIRNAIGYRVLKPEQLQQIVDYYNNTVHKSIGCTPARMQNEPDLEYQYIRWCERKLNEVLDYQESQKMLSYERGNILMVHVDTGKTSEKMEKRRSFYDRIGEFIEYVHGNVKVRLDVPVRITSTGSPERLIVVPVYHTKFIAKNRREIPDNVKDYYVVNAYVEDKNNRGD